MSKTDEGRLASKRLRETATAKNSTPRRNNRVLILIVLSFVILIAAAFTIGRVTAPSVSQVNETTTTKVKKSLTGNSLEQDQKDSLKAAQTLLNSGKTDTDYKSVMSKIESGDFSSVPDEMSKGIYLSDSMDSEGARGSTYQSIIALNNLMLKGEDAKPSSEDAWKSVQLDAENGIAYVPLGVFTGKDVPFTFEMVYVDGEWKLAPFTLLQSIKMSSAISTGDNGSGG